MRPSHRRATFGVLTGLMLAWAGGSAAQQDIRSSVLVLDQDRLFAESTFGVELNRALEEASRQLARENRQIEADLVEKERALTEARPTMTPEAFREAADAFDTQVSRFREEQDAKSQQLVAESDRQRQRFLELVLPVLGGLLSEYGAYVFLDQRQVFLSDDRINVTDEAIARVNAALAEMEAQAGTALPPDALETDPPAPEAETPTAE
ncbi:OmpH family outer membrane protein [Dinoroseobacter sp. S76]|uniref:OmpH family outer membrane protein n=1 Tax=Dinoroseobacter sp. S76 TaxID=3415124 RepID=UPI003C79FA0E